MSLSLVSGLLFIAAPARADQQVEFIDDSSLVLTLPDDDADPESLRVLLAVQGATLDTTVRLLRQGSVASSLSIAPSSADVVAGQATFTVSTTASASEGTGTLVAITSEGALARRDVEIKAAVPPEDVQPPTTLTLLGLRWNWLPWKAHVNTDEHSLADLGLPTDTSPTEVTVASGNSETGTVKVEEDGALSVSGITQAGEYTGTLKTGSGDDISATTLTVRVRDFLLWPLLTLVLGLGLVYWLWTWQNVGAPGWALLLRLRTLQKRARDFRAVFLQEIKKFPVVVNIPSAPRITEPGKEAKSVLLLDVLARRGYAEWLSALDQEERNAWKLGGDRYKALVQNVETYKDSLASLIRAAENLTAADVSRLHLALAKPLDGSPVFHELQGATALPDITDSTELSDFVDKTNAARKDSAALRQLLERLVLLEKERAVDKVRLRSIAERALVVDVGGLPDLAKEANDLSKPVAHIEGEHKQLLGERAAFWRLDFETGDVEALGPILGPPLSLELDSSIEDLLRQYKTREWLIRTAGFALTLLGGMVLLYAPKPIFGSAVDYLSMFLWGTVFGTGAQIATKYITPSGLGS
jgi:hypothetical protein